MERPGWAGGLRAGAGLAVGSFALAVTFGTFAVLNGWPAWLAILMSAVTFSGSAQFALVTAMAGGGGLISGLGSAALINARFLPMAAATGPYLHGGPWRRAVEGQAVVDGSWVVTQTPDGKVDRRKLFGATLVQLPAWTGGTALGALLVPSTAASYTLGLDVVFPGFFALLLLDTLSSRRALVPVALAAATISAAALRVLPAGPSLLLASLAALLPLGGSPDTADGQLSDEPA